VSDVRRFYDELAPLYHLTYEDWDAGVARQGAALASVIVERWGAEAKLVLDAAVGIGTQALGLRQRGFRVIGSDLALDAVRRAGREATARGVPLPGLVADFRALPTRSEAVDVVLVADNALPHLETETEILTALRECVRCVRPGGGCVVSMRDYGAPPPAGTVEVKPYGERHWAGQRWSMRQVWTWRGAAYDLAVELTPLEGEAAGRTIAFTTRYFSITPARVADLMRRAGFERVERLDGRFFQPLLVGDRPRRG
jgi:SAM-dependent methyltransferase